MMGYLEKLEFSKDWTKAEDFPTYEPDESQVRADLQLLHNEAKAAINALVDKLESAEFASHLAVSTEGMTATNLAAALAEILETAKAAQAGTIVDGTVTEAKLAAALLQKINSIDVTYSMNAPTANETPETGYQLGKLWLKPEFSIANLASDYALASGADWTGENVTKEASGGKLIFSGTGDSQYGTAKAEFTVPAGHTVRVWLTVEQTAGQFASLKAYLGTAEYTLTSGEQLVQDVTAGEDGKVAIQVKADWSNTVTAAGGKFTITAFTAVDKAASMLPGCIALTDGNLDALVTAKAPFAETKTRRELYGQQTAGVWKRLAPDEDQTTDEMTVPKGVAQTLGVTEGATLSAALERLYAAFEDVKAVLNGGTAEGIRTMERCVFGYYDGDGTYGAEHPTTLALDFVPKYVELVGSGKSDGTTFDPFRDDESVYFPRFRIMTGTLTTEFQQNQGCCALSLQYNYYGRKSEDGKTLYWYGEQKSGNSDYPMAASVQFNASGARYYYRAYG